MAPKNSNKPTTGAVSLLIGTMKGAFLLRSDAKRSKWTMRQPWFFGHIVNHVVQDPRDKKVLVAGVKTGHLGPTVYRSVDGGKTWKEASKPPMFPKVEGAEEGKGLAVDKVFHIAPDHVSKPGCWYAGTVPWGLFHSSDNGDTWEAVKGFNEHPNYDKWGFDSPDGKITHSIFVDPRDANHLYVSLSVGGFFESTDGGRTWDGVNKGCQVDFGPEKEPEFGHDPHCTAMCGSDPDRFYMQNHCGIYRMDRAEGRWHRVGDNMPKAIRDIGFPVVAHPRDRDRVWVFPMDGTSVWPRTSVAGKPATYFSKDAGKSWKRQEKGFPKQFGYFCVLRQAMTSDRHDPLGLYLGTTSGEVWGTRNEGGKWSQLCQHLPRILSITVAR